jgi:SAM-dependent methyltransferase
MDKEANLFLSELYKRMPIDKNHPYFNMGAEEFYQKHRFMAEFYEDNYRAILPKDKTIKILDIGFGFGMFMVYMKKEGFKDIHGIETSKAQVDNAKKMGFQVELISDLSDYLRKNQSQFDLIHASNFAEHLPKYDLIEIFDLLYNSLKDRGMLVVTTPNIASYRGMYNRYLVLGHEVGFTEVSLRQIFEVTNFSGIEILSSRIKFRPRIKHILMKIFQKIINIIIAILDYVYLGVDRPRHLGKYLFGIGFKK